MFVRNLSYHIKDGKLDDFNRTFTAEVLPILKNQPGFKDELTFFDKSDGFAISMWQDRASADRYVQSAYGNVLEKLTPYLTGTPAIKTYDVGASTLAH